MIGNEKFKLMDIDVTEDQFQSAVVEHDFPDVLNPDDLTKEDAVGVDVPLLAPAVQRTMTGGPNNGNNNQSGPFLTLLVMTSLDSLSRIVTKLEASQRDDEEFDNSCLIRQIKLQGRLSSDLQAELELIAWSIAAQQKSNEISSGGLNIDGRNFQIDPGSIYEDVFRIFPAKTEGGSSLNNQYCESLASHVVGFRPGLVRAFERKNHAQVGKVYWLGEGKANFIKSGERINDIKGDGLRKIMAKHASNAFATEAFQTRFTKSASIIDLIKKTLLDTKLEGDREGRRGERTKFKKTFRKIGTKGERNIVIVVDDSNERFFITVFPTN